MEERSQSESILSPEEQAFAAGFRKFLKSIDLQAFVGGASNKLTIPHMLQLYRLYTGFDDFATGVHRQRWLEAQRFLQAGLDYMDSTNLNPSYVHADIAIEMTVEFALRLRAGQSFSDVERVLRAYDSYAVYSEDDMKYDSDGRLKASMEVETWQPTDADDEAPTETAENPYADFEQTILDDKPLNPTLAVLFNDQQAVTSVVRQARAANDKLLEMKSFDDVIAELKDQQQLAEAVAKTKKIVEANYTACQNRPWPLRAMAWTRHLDNRIQSEVHAFLSLHPQKKEGFVENSAELLPIWFALVGLVYLPLLGIVQGFIARARNVFAFANWLGGSKTDSFGYHTFALLGLVIAAVPCLAWGAFGSVLMGLTYLRDWLNVLEARLDRVLTDRVTPDWRGKITRLFVAMFYPLVNIMSWSLTFPLFFVGYGGVTRGNEHAIRAHLGLDILYFIVGDIGLCFAPLILPYVFMHKVLGAAFDILHTGYALVDPGSYGSEFNGPSTEPRSLRGTWVHLTMVVAMGFAIAGMLAGVTLATPIVAPLLALGLSAAMATGMANMAFVVLYSLALVAVMQPLYHAFWRVAGYRREFVAEPQQSQLAGVDVGVDSAIDKITGLMPTAQSEDTEKADDNPNPHYEWQYRGCCPGAETSAP